MAEGAAKVDYLVDAVDLAVDGRHRATDRKGQFIVIKLFLPGYVVGLAD